jgi:F-type H+-transporting ATPase subunit b
MLIDWFTLGAQALNFLILVWLLQRFLYKPVLDAIDAREKRVAAELAEAAAKKGEARRERDEFQQKNEEFSQERAALLRQATDAARAEGQRLLAEARQAAVTLRARQQETLREEERSLHQEISRRARQEVFAIVRKALTDLAATSLEERMVAVFLRRLSDLANEEKAQLCAPLTESAGPLLVRTAFDLSPAQAEATATAIRKTLGGEMEVRFATAPDLISGIELSVNGQKVGWSIAEYLTALEHGVAELLQEKTKNRRAAEAGPA